MGIHGLMKLITEEAPQALKEKEMDNLNDRKVAIDASMAIYQFLVAVRSSGPSGGGGASMQLTNEAGDVTSHIQGMFNRTIKMMESGVKPVYVFDGKPPQMKGGELAKRIAKRAKAETDLSAATESGDVDEIDKFSRRLVKATRQHSEECKELLALMGVPFVNAPCEAEAQCAELAEKGKVFATATEDMDALTFRTPKLLRRFTSSQGKEKQPIIEVDFALMLTGLGLTYVQFVDLCILCGCDYCSAIKGIGPKTALRLVKLHGCIENIVTALKKEKKYVIPPDWQFIKVSKSARIQAEKEEEEAMAAAAEKRAAAAEASASATAASSSSSASTSTSASSSMPADSSENTGEAPIDGTTSGTVAVEKSAVNSVEGTDTIQAEGAGETEAEAEAEVEGVVEDPMAAEMNEEVEEKIEESTPSASKDVLEQLQTDSEVKDDGILIMKTAGDDEEEEYETIAPLYIQARLLFLEADVTPADRVELKWEEPKESELRKFLVERMGFNADRVSTGIQKLQTAHRKKSQKRMDSFFTSTGVSTSSTSLKRKADEVAGKGAPKKGAKAAPAKKAGSKPGPKKR